MKLRTSTVALATMTFLAVAAGSAHAAGTYLAHTIPGEELGLDPTLPVDIALNGVCTPFTGITYETVTTVEDLGEGSALVEIFASDGACGGPLAASGIVDLVPGETALIIAHLDENNSPTVSKFSLETTGLPRDEAGVSFLHLAGAPAVDIELYGRTRPHGRTLLEVKGLENGAQSSSTLVRSGDYRVRIRAAGGGPTVLHDRIGLRSDRHHTLIAAGSLENGTFRPLILEIPAP